MAIEEVLARRGPRKLLALDGGGIRGIISLEVLAAIEALLQKSLGRDDSFTLAEYFDYIGGTSTGAIIATCLSLGMRVDHVRHFYLTGAHEMFAKARWRDRLRYKYDYANLERLLREQYGSETTLGSDKLRTLLLLVMRNASTNSPWPVSNNPRARYNAPDRADCNLNLPLWKLVRASTAAPGYFEPELVELGERSFVFVDGGVTPFNNPAFQMFLMATLPEYRLGWTAGKDEMLVVSIGTGGNTRHESARTPRQMTLLYDAKSVPNALIAASMREQDLLCRVFGDCRLGEAIDSEVGDLKGTAAAGWPKLFSYVRFDVDLSEGGLKRLGLEQVRVNDVQALDSVEHVAELRQVGERLAQQVQPELFSGFLAG